MFTAAITRTFCAAHALRLPGGGLEPLHGHNWQTTVTVASEQLDELGCVMDFHDLERQLDAIIGPWHNANLNEIAPFDAVVNPSAENVARQIADALTLPDGVSLRRVEVTEAEGCAAAYEPA
ncbi:MAG: 6-carboxytetrahydropterin synthase [Planctomycetota bacterium]